MSRLKFSNRGPRRRLCCTLLFASVCMVAPITGWSAAGDDLYYKVGGGGPVSASAGRGYQPGQLGLGVNWNQGSACSGLNPQATVANQLNGVTTGFQNMMGSVIQSATGAVAALPAMIIQRAAPGLYDLLSNGVLQGRLDFNKAKTSCKAIAGRAADEVTGGWQKQAQAENWESTATENEDAVAAQQSVEIAGGDKGVTWVGGAKRGGDAQEPVAVTNDTAVAGYNILQGRTDPTSTQPVSGGGQGWGTVPTSSDSWPGGGGPGSDSMTGNGCHGGMCTVWGSPAEASDWITDVVGEKQIRTCGGCEKVRSKSGTGLMRALEDQQEEIEQKLTAMVDGSQPINDASLQEVSAGSALSVSRGVIKSLQHSAQGSLLTHRLASEMALARTLTQALWARRVLLAGADEPGIANNKQGQDAINGEMTHLDRGIEALRIEMEVRQTLAHSAATVALSRDRGRSDRGKPTGTNTDERKVDSRGAIDGD